MSKKHQQLNVLLVREAARLMIEENVSQYLDAKKRAAKRLFGKPMKHLPSNQAIADEIYRQTQLINTEDLQQQLLEMRRLAIKVMDALQDFSPRLIGSVSTGRIRESSDVDIHVFTDSIEHLSIFLDHLGWQYEQEKVTIYQKGKLIDYQHFYLWFDYPVELSVYSAKEIRHNTKSSIDGKSIKRLSVSKVRELLDS